MTGNAGLVERLREIAVSIRLYEGGPSAEEGAVLEAVNRITELEDSTREAAARIEALQAENALLKSGTDIRGILRSLRPSHESGPADKRLNRAISLILARQALASTLSDSGGGTV